MLPVKTRQFSRGHTLLELLLVVAIAGGLTATGGYMLQALLQRQQVNLAKTTEAVYYNAMIRALQFAYDQRCLDPFTEEPWLFIETGEGEDWYPLHSLELIIIENNKRVPWKWAAPGLEPVYINVPTTRFLSHQQPRSMRLKFPLSTLPLPEDGIAIEGIRESVLLKE